MSRKRSGARMYQRPGRSGWYAQLDSEHKNIGLGTDDEAEAKIKFAELLERRRLLDLAPAERPISEIFQLTRARAETNNTSKTSYEDHLNLRRILLWLEERKIGSAKKVDLAVVEDYKTMRRFQTSSKNAKRKISASRINRELTSWLKAWKVAVELKVVPPSALAMFHKLREPRPAPHQRRLNKDDLTKFFALVPAEYVSLLRVVLGSAIRDEEMRHLSEQDLIEGVSGRWVRVSPKPPGWCECHPLGWSSKSYRFRDVPVTQETIEAGRRFLATRAAINLDVKRVWKVINKAAKDAGVHYFSLHDLRKAWATAMIDAGNTLQTVSKWLGHADLMTTMRYLGISDDAHPGDAKLPW